MELTPLRRTILVMLLVAMPWFMIGVFSWIFLLRSHLESNVTDWFWMRVAIAVGGILCILALAIFLDGVRKKQVNVLMNLFALSALWYLIEWPAKALLAILRSF